MECKECFHEGADYPTIDAALDAWRPEMSLTDEDMWKATVQILHERAEKAEAIAGAAILERDLARRERNAAESERDAARKLESDGYVANLRRTIADLSQSVVAWRLRAEKAEHDASKCPGCGTTAGHHSALDCPLENGYEWRRERDAAREELRRLREGLEGLPTFTMLQGSNEYLVRLSDIAALLRGAP